jgi:uncharacterized lipoprotein YajG
MRNIRKTGGDTVASTMRILLPLAVLLFLVTTGCAPKNEVPLVPPEVEARMPTCSRDMVVMDFTDGRADTARIGTDREGKPFTAEGDVGDWVSWSLFEALSGRGCHARYRTKLLPGETAPVITGKVTALDLRQTGFVTYVLDIAVVFRVQKAGETEPMWSHTVTVNMERSDFPDDANPQDMLADALAEVLSDAVPQIMAQAR